MRLLPLAQILFGCGFTLAVACALGRWFLRATGAWPLLSRGERLVFSFGLGAACLSNVVFALAAAQLVYPAVFLAAGALLLWAGWRGAAGGPAPQLEPAGTRALWLLAPAAAAYGYLYLMHAMAPEISPDGAGYHLGLVGRYLREHGFSRITTHIYALLSQGAEMLFLFAYAFGRHSAAKMVHFAFLVATVAAALLFGRRFRLGPAAPVAAAFFAISPVVGVDATSSYNDCALALMSFLTFYLLLIWEQDRARQWLPAIGVAAGFCYAIKYTGFLVVPLALAFLAWKARPWWGPALRVAAFASLSIVPWMAKNAIVTGNPLAPFFNEVFPNPYTHVSFERMYRFLMRHYSGLAEHNWSDYWRFPWELAVSGGPLQGLLGPLFLLAPLGLWSLRSPVGRRVWLAAAVMVLPWFTNIGTRFLIPALPWISLGMALALWQAPRRVAGLAAAALVAGHAIGSWPAMIERWNFRQPWRLDEPPWKAALRIESESEYLGRVLPGYHVARLVDEVVPPGARVLAPESILEAYTSREVLVSYQCASCQVLMDHLLTPVIQDFGPVWNIRFDWEPRRLSGLRLRQTGADRLEQWSIHEMLLYSPDGYQTPRPDWVLRAWPNPWDAALAFDGNQATRWRTWWPLYSGMRFQVELPAPQTLTALEVQCSADQYEMKLELEARDAEGRWSPLAAKFQRNDRIPPRRHMKRWATLELKAQGIGYLLTDLEGQGMNLIAPDIQKDPSAWGLKQVGAHGPIRLYQIEAAPF